MVLDAVISDKYALILQSEFHNLKYVLSLKME